MLNFFFKTKHILFSSSFTLSGKLRMLGNQFKEMLPDSLWGFTKILIKFTLNFLKGSSYLFSMGGVVFFWDNFDLKYIFNSTLEYLFTDEFWNNVYVSYHNKITNLLNNFFNTVLKELSKFPPKDTSVVDTEPEDFEVELIGSKNSFR